VLFSKIESYVQMVSDQVLRRGQYYPREWEVYVPKALSEYKNYLSRYYQLEVGQYLDSLPRLHGDNDSFLQSEGGDAPLRPVPLKIMQSHSDGAIGSPVVVRKSTPSPGALQRVDII
jgi:hypothetical protein